MTARGSAWERELAAQHVLYRRDRLAVVWQTHPRRDASGRYLEAAPVDFLGALLGGRAVALDAKEHAGPRWPLSQLHDHQARDLEAVHLAGGIAGVALRLGGEGWWVPWAELRATWQAWRAGGRPASVDGAWLVGSARRMSGADWLAEVVL